MLERVWRKGKRLVLLVGMQIDIATVWEQYGSSLKTDNRTTIWPSNPSAGHIPRENHNSKRHMHPRVRCSTSSNSQTMEALKCLSTEEGIKKMCIQRMLLSHQKEQKWVVCRDVDGPGDCYTRWRKSEREKQISCVNTWNLEKWYRSSHLQKKKK